MKVVLLAGGYGSRLSEETSIKPKPMIEIGGQPILWHIMKIYSSFGLDDFIICGGYRSHSIKQYFAEYFLRRSDVTFDIRNNQMEVHRSSAEPWRVTVVHTGQKTMMGRRIKRVREYLGDEAFCMTYGDGLSDIDIGRLINFHREQGALATLTAVQPPGRFGAFTLEAGTAQVTRFKEKAHDGLHEAWVNGGFFVLEPRVIDYIEGDDTVWEQGPLEALAAAGQLAAYRHEGFWQPMDTLRDKAVLEELWQSGRAPWKR